MTKRALLVDDDGELLETLTRALGSLGFECDTARTDEVARNYLQKNAYDAIMVDLCMDVGSFTIERRSFCEELKRNGQGARLIGMTGWQLTNRQMFELGQFCLDDFLDKNCDLQRFESLRAALGSGARPMTRKRFRVAMSYNRAFSDKVRPVANRLRLEYGQRGVFFDEYYQAELARRNADTYLERTFQLQADVVVAFLCDGYGKQNWCQIEWRAIRSVAHSVAGPDVLLIRLAPGEVPGFNPEVDIYLDATNMSSEDMAGIIIYRIDNPTPR